MRCSVCNEPQFDTPSGVTCSNGHGGAPSVENLPLNKAGSKDFEFYIADPDGHQMHVEMTHGSLSIDNCEYEYEGDPETYALVIEVAKHRGLLK